MTDLKPEDLVKLREAAEATKHKAGRTRRATFAAWDEFGRVATPEVVLSLLTDRARMEKALLQVETMLARCEDKAKPKEDPQFHYSQLVGMRKGLFSARKVARQALGASK